MCCSILHGHATVVHFPSHFLTHFILYKGKRIMKLATIYHNFIQLIPHFAGIKKENIPKTMQTCCVGEEIGNFFCRGFKKLDEYGEIKTKAIHHFNWQVRDRRRLIAHWSEWLGDLDLFLSFQIINPIFHRPRKRCQNYQTKSDASKD